MLLDKLSACRHHDRLVYHNIISRGVLLFFVVTAFCLSVCLTSTISADAAEVNTQEPPQALRNVSHLSSVGNAYRVAEPFLKGWTLLDAKLQGIGYSPAAPQLGRYVFIMGGIIGISKDKKRRDVSMAVFVRNYTSRRVNAFEMASSTMKAVAWELKTNVVDPREEMKKNRTRAVYTALKSTCSSHIYSQSHHRTSATTTTQTGQSNFGKSADPDELVERMMRNTSMHSENTDGGGALPLPFPVVGANSAVRLASSVYVIGFCNVLPPWVHVGSPPRTRSVNAQKQMPSRGIHSTVDDVNDDDDNRSITRDYLLSVQRIRLLQRDFPEVDEIAIEVVNWTLPLSAVLRYNASCVPAADLIYIIGGVNAETGEELRTVAQYNVTSGVFVDAVWSFEKELVTPAVAAHSQLLYVAGGFSTVHGVFFPSLETSEAVAVLDTAHTVLASHVGDYAEDSLGWFSPQMFVHGKSALLSGGAYDTLALWQDMTESTSIFTTTGASATSGLFSNFSIPRRHKRGTRSLCTLLEAGFEPQRQHAVLAVTPFSRAHFSFSSRAVSSSVMSAGDAKVGEDDGYTMYLFGGNVPPPSGSDTSEAAPDIFIATVHYSSPSYAVPSNSSFTIGKEKKRGHEGAGGHVTEVTMTAAAMAASTPELIGFTYQTVLLGSSWSRATTTTTMPAAQPNKGEMPPSPLIVQNAEVPNQEGNITIYVNGYVPLWYNVSFRVLLLHDVVSMCPGIVTPTPLSSSPSISHLSNNRDKGEEHDGGGGESEETHSQCELALSLTPQCDTILARVKRLGSRNTWERFIPVLDDAGNVTGTQMVMSVGEVMIIGSREAGILHVLFAEEEEGSYKGEKAPLLSAASAASLERRNSIAKRLPLWQQRQNTHSSTTIDKGEREKTDYGGGGGGGGDKDGSHIDDDTDKINLQPQVFVYVCFSTASSSVAKCQEKKNSRSYTAAGSDVTTTDKGKERGSASFLYDGTDQACASSFYQVLNAQTPLVLSPVTTWKPDTPTPPPTPPPPTPTPPHRDDIRAFAFGVTGMLTVAAVMLLWAGSGRDDWIRGGSAAGEDYSDSDEENEEGGEGVNSVGGRRAAAEGAGIRRSLFPSATTWFSREQGRRYRRRSHHRQYRRQGDDAGDTGNHGNDDDSASQHYEGEVSDPERGRQGHKRRGQDRNTHGAAAAATNAQHNNALLEGKYRVVRRLGRGSFSIVYLVERVQDRRLFALKYVQCSDDTDRHAAMKECEVAYALQDHPNVIQLVDMFLSYRFDNYIASERSNPPKAGTSIPAATAGAATAVPKPTNGGKSTGPILEGSPTGAVALTTSEAPAPEQRQTERQLFPLPSPSAMDSSPSPSPPPGSVMVRIDTTVGDETTACLPPQQRYQQYYSYRDEMRGMEGGRMSSGGAVYGAHNTRASRRDYYNHRPHHQQQQQEGPSHGERYLSLVMAYQELGDLGQWVRRQKASAQLRVPEATVASIAYQVLSVLRYMHSRTPPIVHRDLKPENILLTSTVKYEGVSADFLPVLVTDFGLARVMDATFCETGVGSLPYVAPECWQRRYSTKVDLWALGCILYAVCAKRVESDNVRVMFSESVRPDFASRNLTELTQVWGYSTHLAQLIVSLLEVDVGRRPSATDALKMLCERPLPFMLSPAASASAASPGFISRSVPTAQQRGGGGGGGETLGNAGTSASVDGSGGMLERLSTASTVKPSDGLVGAAAAGASSQEQQPFWGHAEQGEAGITASAALPRHLQPSQVVVAIPRDPSGGIPSSSSQGALTSAARATVHSGPLPNNTENAGEMPTARPLSRGGDNGGGSGEPSYSIMSSYSTSTTRIDTSVSGAASGVSSHEVIPCHSSQQEL